MATRNMVPIILAAIFLASPANAHHAFVAVYDPAQIIEIEGEVVSVAWRNPHITLSVEVRNEEGDTTVWNIEGNQKNMLARMGVPDGLINPGDHLRIAGNPARKRPNRMFVTNILLDDGRELVTFTTAKARWSDKALGEDSALLTGGASYESVQGDPDIFRVWSSNFGDRESYPIWHRSYPLTDAARKALADWDLESHVILSCNHFGMPTIMAAPDPIEFVDGGDKITLRIETFNVERTIHVRGEFPTEIVATPLGYSIGRWGGRALSVMTRGIDWPHFDQTGIPQSETASIMEYFLPSADGRKLDYVLVVSDRGSFTEPVQLNKHWVWRPHEKVEHYTDDEDCARLPL